MIGWIRKLWGMLPGASLPKAQELAVEQLAYAELELLKALSEYERARHALAMYRERVSRLRAGWETDPSDPFNRAAWGLSSAERRTTTPSSL